MWIQIEKGKYGKVNEIIDVAEIQAKISALQAKRDDRLQEHFAVSAKIEAIEDEETKGIASKALEDTSAPIVMLDANIQEYQAILDEIGV